MTDLLNQSWYDGNASRNFPLTDEAQRMDVTGSFQLPNGLLVDLRLFAPSNLDPTLFHLLSCSGYGTGVVLQIGNNGVAVGTVTVPTSGSATYQTYQVTPLPAYPDVGGSVTLGLSDAIALAGQGSYQFTVAATRIIPTLVSDSQFGVTSLTVIDQFGVSTRLTGDVSFVGGTNVTVTPSGQTLVLTLQPGVVLGDPCTCSDQQGNILPPVTTINGVAPDSSGNVQLVPDTGCISFAGATGSLTVTDTCATPCCGSPEIRQLAESAVINNNHIGILGNKIGELQAALRMLAPAVGR